MKTKRVLAAAFALLLCLGTAAQAKTTYSKSLYNKIWKNATLVVDGVVAETKAQDGELLCTVELQGAYKAENLGVNDVALEYGVYLPVDASEGDKVLLFLKRDSAGSWVKAHKASTGLESVVYRPDDYAYVKARLPREYVSMFSRKELIAFENQSKTMQYTQVLDAYFKAIPESFGGLYFDNENEGVLTVILTKKADEKKIRADVAKMTDSTAYVSVIVRDQPSQAELYALTDEITAAYEKLTPEQKERVPLSVWGADIMTGKVKVGLTRLNDETIRAFRELVMSAIDGVIFDEVDPVVLEENVVVPKPG